MGGRVGGGGSDEKITAVCENNHLPPFNPNFQVERLTDTVTSYSVMLIALC